MCVVAAFSGHTATLVIWMCSIPPSKASATISGISVERERRERRERREKRERDVFGCSFVRENRPRVCLCHCTHGLSCCCRRRCCCCCGCRRSLLCQCPSLSSLSLSLSRCEKPGGLECSADSVCCVCADVSYPRKHPSFTVRPTQLDDGERWN